jgi:hypothetical protein
MTTEEMIYALADFLMVIRDSKVESYKTKSGVLSGCLTHLKMQQFFAADQEEKEELIKWWADAFKTSGFVRDAWRRAKKKNFRTKTFTFEDDEAIAFQKKWGMSPQQFAVQPNSVKIIERKRFEDYRELS